MTISNELLNILVCPQCRQKVKFSPEKSSLICKNCRLAYPMLEDIPVMLVSEAEHLDKI